MLIALFSLRSSTFRDTSDHHIHRHFQLSLALFTIPITIPSPLFLLHDHDNDIIIKGLGFDDFLESLESALSLLLKPIRVFVPFDKVAQCYYTNYLMSIYSTWTHLSLLQTLSTSPLTSYFPLDTIYHDTS